MAVDAAGERRRAAPRAPRAAPAARPATVSRSSRSASPSSVSRASSGTTPGQRMASTATSSRRRSGASASSSAAISASGSCAGARDQRPQARLAEALAAGQRGVEDAVRVEHERVAGADLDRLGAPFGRLDRAEQRARAPDLEHLPVAHEQRRRMARRARTEARPGSSGGSATAATVQRESVLAAAQRVVELVERRARIAGEAPRRAQRDARDGAQRGGRRALAGHVADDDDRAGRRVDHLVEVAAGLHALARRAVAQGHLAAGHLRRLVGREPGGEHVGDLVALAVQARVAQRLADAAAERVGQLEHVVVEAPVGLGRAEHEHAEDRAPRPGRARPSSAVRPVSRSSARCSASVASACSISSVMPATRSGSPVRSTAASPDGPSSAHGMAAAQLPRARRAVGIGVRHRDGLEDARRGRAGRCRTSPRASGTTSSATSWSDASTSSERLRASPASSSSRWPISARRVAVTSSVTLITSTGRPAASRIAVALMSSHCCSPVARTTRRMSSGSTCSSPCRRRNHGRSLVVQVAAVGVEQREALPQLRQVERVVRAAGVEHGPRGGVGQDDPPVQVAHVDRVVHVVDQRLELAREAPPRARRRGSARRAAPTASANRRSGSRNGARRGPVASTSRPSARPCARSGAAISELEAEPAQRPGAARRRRGERRRVVPVREHRPALGSAPCRRRRCGRGPRREQRGLDLRRVRPGPARGQRPALRVLYDAQVGHRGHEEVERPRAGGRRARARRRPRRRARSGPRAARRPSASPRPALTARRVVPAGERDEVGDAGQVEQALDLRRPGQHGERERRRAGRRRPSRARAAGRRCRGTRRPPRSRVTSSRVGAPARCSASRTGPTVARSSSPRGPDRRRPRPPP